MGKHAVDKGSGPAADSRRARLGELLLARLAGGPVTAREALRDLAAFAGTPGLAAAFKAELALALAALEAEGFVASTATRLELTGHGRARVSAALGLAPEAVGSDWDSIRDLHLVARALGIEAAPAARRKAALKADGLRALVVEAAFGIDGGGRPSASRIRSRLAVKALERAFGNSIRAGLKGKTGMSAKASRLLAGQLARKPRQHTTDARLVAQLAAEAVEVAKPDLAQLRIGVVRHWLAHGTIAAAGMAAARPATGQGNDTPAGTAAALGPGMLAVAPAAPAPAAPAAPQVRLVAQTPAAPAAAAFPAPAPRRPDPAAFARAVAAAAAARAEGWPGNRKAFVSHVWTVIRERHPDWGVSEIEFKSMLAEAHRMGLVSLANADLKDRRTLAEVEASAVSWKNTVWHYVRVED